MAFIYFHSHSIAQHIINGLSPSATTALNAHATIHPNILRQPWQLWDYLFGIYGNYTEQQIQLIKDKLNSPIADTDTLASHVGLCTLVEKKEPFWQAIRKPFQALLAN